MRECDSIQRFMFDNAEIRGEIVHLDETINRVMSKHDYPNTIEKLLGELTLCAVLMSAIIKFKGQLTLQFKSDKAVTLLLVKCNHLFQLRALARYDKKASSVDYINALQDGQLVVTIEADHNVKPYQSIVKLKSSITETFEYYFAQSEQLPSRFWLTYQNGRAAGMLLQMMPKKNSSSNREIFWEHATKLGETLTENELLNLDNETLLYRLYHGESIRLFEKKRVQFHCPCQRARMLEVVRTVGRKDAMAILKTHKSIDVVCKFCLQQFAFDKVDIEYLFHQSNTQPA